MLSLLSLKQSLLCGTEYRITEVSWKVLIRREKGKRWRGGALICTLTSLWVGWCCADGCEDGLRGLCFLQQQIISFCAWWVSSYEPQRCFLFFFLSWGIFFHTFPISLFLQNEDINLKLLRQVLVRFDSESIKRKAAEFLVLQHLSFMIKFIINTLIRCKTYHA